MKSLNTRAVGGYFRGLRLARQLSPAEVAVGLKQQLRRNIDPSTIWRVETGNMKLTAELCLALLEVLRGRVEDVWLLFRLAEASDGDGEAIGRLVAGDASVLAVEDQLRAAISAASPDQRRAALAAIRRQIQALQSPD